MHIIIAVTNDIVSDQRVIRTAQTLFNLPARITVIGRLLSNDLSYTGSRFHPVRMKMLFNRGPLFYAEYNLRLFLRLMFADADVLVSNDLDTLPAVFLASRIRHKIILYDSHEYFTEVPELVGRRRTKRIWEWLESRMLPHIHHAYTVSKSIASVYQQKYGTEFKVIRNLPYRRDPLIKPSITLRKEREKIVLYQGSLNMGRGLELAIRAIGFTRNVRLVLIGRGDVEIRLKELASSLGLGDNITFTGRILPDRLFDFTVQADLGISIEEDLGLNYRFSLPNKVFDYIQAGVPVLVSDLPEVRTLVEHYDVGMVNTASNAEELGRLITEILDNNHMLMRWKTNLKIAAAELCWENEEQKLISIYRDALSNKLWEHPD